MPISCVFGTSCHWYTSPLDGVEGGGADIGGAIATGRLLEQPVIKPTAIQAKPTVEAIFFVIKPVLPTHKNGLTSIITFTEAGHINVPQT